MHSADQLYHRVIETHYKTLIVLISFLITVGGWWLWNIFLSLAYDPYNRWPYNVRDGFLKHFGQDGSWWASLFLSVAVLVLGELVPLIYRQVMHRSIGRSVRDRLLPHSWRASLTRDEDLDVAMWQELENDPNVQHNLKELAKDA